MATGSGGKKELRLNEQIKVRGDEVRLIGPEGEAVGVVKLMDAQLRARAAEMDLVEISPTATPPVCRIMDYGKYKYQQTKKEHEARRKHQGTELKQLRIRSYKIGDHDLRIKLKQARQFLEAGHRVLFTLMFRAREHGHADLGAKVLAETFGLGLADIAKVEAPPRKDGRKMTMSLAPLPNLKQILAARAKEAEEARRKAEAEGRELPPEPVDEPLPPEDLDDEDDFDDEEENED